MPQYHIFYDLLALYAPSVWRQIIKLLLKRKIEEHDISMFFSAFYSPGNKLTPSSVLTVQSNVAGGLAASWGCPASYPFLCSQTSIGFPPKTPLHSCKVSKSSLCTWTHIVLLWSTWYPKHLSLSSYSTGPLEQPFQFLNNFIYLLLYPLFVSIFQNLNSSEQRYL